MNNATRQLVEQIHAAECRFVLAVSGGGSGAISDLLTVPGGSRSLIEAVVPYSAAALDDWLGAKPDQYCSEQTARAMAISAFQRARALAPHDSPTELLGVGCTASLASDRPKRGAHRVHVARQTSGETVVESLELKKGLRDRAGEERVAATMILSAIAAASSSREAPDRPALPEPSSPDELYFRRSRTAFPAWTDLLLGSREVVFVDGAVSRNRSSESGPQFVDPQSCDLAAQPMSNTASPTSAPEIVFPGAFNPFHDGHRQMAEFAEQRLGKPVWFELSMANVDKPPLDFIEISDRLDSLAGMPVVLTRAARFTEKAAVFPRTTFIVGADTIERIADPRYYDGEQGRAARAIRSIVAQGCRFLVFGRKIDGEFTGLDDLRLPAELRNRCEGVSMADFREDISSTELRARNRDARRLHSE